MRLALLQNCLHVQTPKATIPFGSVKEVLLDFLKCDSNTEVFVYVLGIYTEIFIDNYN